MIHQIVTYFIRFGQLDIPAIGNLKLSKKEAEWAEGVLIAPKEIIQFELGDSIPNKHFYQYIANALDISAEQAAIQYEQILNSQLEQDHKLVLGNLGVLTKEGNSYQWFSHFDSTQYFNNLDLSSLPNSVSFDEEEAIQKSDKWYIWAIVLSVIAIIAILFKQ
ncbi:MAG: hypothetical protein WCP61_04395 [Chitinophagia bacterium]|jgi:transcriptional regulator with XRE-family HTH domain